MKGTSTNVPARAVLPCWVPLSWSAGSGGLPCSAHRCENCTAGLTQALGSDRRSHRSRKRAAMSSIATASFIIAPLLDSESFHNAQSIAPTHHIVAGASTPVQCQPRLQGEETTVQHLGRIGVLLAVLGAVFILALAACGEGSESGEHSSGSEPSEHSGEAESGEHGEGSESDEDGEESGAQFGLGDTFDQIRAGARLVLSYDSTANAFTGTVTNTTGNTLPRVRVEVHLSNGVELGPTEPGRPSARSRWRMSRSRQAASPSPRGAHTPRSAETPTLRPCRA